MTDRSAVTAPAPVDPEVSSRLRLAIARLNRQMVRASSGQDLTFAQLSALARIEERGPMRLGEVAARERVAASSMTRTLAPLTAQGLIGKAPDPQDGRSCLIEITPHGASVIARIRRERAQLLARRMESLSPRQWEAIYAALPVLEALADDPRDG